jgi:alcohol dehydrogenase
MEEEMISNFFMPTRSIMGSGSMNEIPNEMKNYNVHKPLVVAGKVLQRTGIVQKVLDVLEHAGMQAVVVTDIQPNPTDENVHNAWEVYKTNKCDSIIALGGGSPMDAAKGVGILVNNGGNIRDYEGVDKTTRNMPPFIAVNTTAGTASEMTRFTIITDTSRHIKMAIVDWRITPNTAINDPDLMITMPKSLTAATGMDALTHAVEAYVSIAASPITDACGIKAIELIGKYLPTAVEDGNNLEARDMMSYAEYMAGMAFNSASLGYVHAMAHQLGGLYDLPHGVCNAILLPHVCRFNLESNPAKFADIAAALGINTKDITITEAAQLAIEAIVKLSRAVGIPAGLSEFDLVNKDDFTLLATNAQADVCNLTNPRRASLEEVIAIYESAY